MQAIIGKRNQVYIRPTELYDHARARHPSLDNPTPQYSSSPPPRPLPPHAHSMSACNPSARKEANSRSKTTPVSHSRQMTLRPRKTLKPDRQKLCYEVM